MKKFAIFSLLLGLLLLPNTSFASDNGTINVSLSTSKELTPTSANITFTVETSDKNASKATLDNQTLSNELYTVLKSLIDEKRGDYLKTSSYTAQPTYDYINQKRVFNSYVVTNKVTVYTKDVDIVSKLIDNAMKKGATNVDDLNYSVDNYDNQCGIILGELTRQAFENANNIVKPINKKVVGVKSLTTSCYNSSSNNYYRSKGVALMNATAESDSTPIEKGKLKINATLDSIFFIK